MNRLPPDAGTVCVALELDSGYLADLFRREAARVMRVLADRLEGDPINIEADPVIDHATHLLLIAQAFDEEWERLEGESDGAVGRNGGDSLTPPPPPSQGSTVAQSERARG